MFLQVLFCRVLLDESGALFALPWHNCGQKETVTFFAAMSLLRVIKSSHWAIVNKINFRVFVGDDYHNPILWNCVTPWKTLGSEEAMFRGTIKVWWLIDCCFSSSCACTFALGVALLCAQMHEALRPMWLQSETSIL